MATQACGVFDEVRLQTIELDAAPLTQIELGGGPEGDSRIRKYLEVLPPRAALELIRELRDVRDALDGAVAALERAGFTVEAYCALSDAEQDSPTWRAVRRARQVSGSWPEFVMRYTHGGEHHARSFPTRAAALNAAIEVLEMHEGHPDWIDTRE